jgi:hypothetical protein
MPTALETNAREEESLKTQNNHTAGGASIDSGSKSNGLCFGDRWVVGDDHTIHNVVIVDVVRSMSSSSSSSVSSQNLKTSSRDFGHIIDAPHHRLHLMQA